MKKLRIRLPGGLLMVVLPVIFLFGCSRENSVKITLGGDVMLARDGEIIFSDASIWEGTAALFDSADLSMANLESPLTDEERPDQTVEGYNLCSPIAGLELIKSSGINYFSLENNHSNDCNENGTVVTKKLLDAAALYGFDTEPLHVIKNGQRFSLISAEDISAPLDLELLTNTVRREKQKDNFVMVSIHWGNEYQASVDARQEQIAQTLADAGADLIWGHHPHVLQRMEWLEGSSGNQTLVIYSLGNLISDQVMLKSTQRTAIITLIVDHGEITNIQAFPFILDFYKGQLVQPDDTEQKIILESLDFSKVEMKLKN